jgi:thiopurine S-methyltransferase
MDNAGWLRLWEEVETPRFHGEAPHVHLRVRLADLALPPGAHIFVPLCGKTRDIGWLRSQGHRVSGVELSPRAVEQLFRDLGEEPTVTAEGALTRYETRAITVYAGDIFDMAARHLGPVDAVYDRAALLALPPPVRRRYAAHVTAITAAAPQLLLSFQDGRAPDDGPPYPVPPEEIAAIYPGHEARLVAITAPDAGPVWDPGDVDHVWLLRPR